MDSFSDPDREYGDGEVNDTAGWYEIDLTPIQPDGWDLPFRLFVNRFESSSPDSERFLHDPRKELGGLIAEFNDDWKVTTFVVNHHRTLSYKHLYVMASSSTLEQTVAVTAIKQPGPKR